jgi:serine/threonine-protein kinase
VELIAGERIGNYRIEGEIEGERGTTGASLLYEAQHLVVPRRAIIKVIRTGLATDRSLVVQTLREASILESIAHPGVPIVYEAGCLRDREPWFAFEANSGLTLDALLAFGPFPVVVVAALLRDIADILEHAHDRGVIHRGLRPGRIVISTAGRYPLCIPDWSDAIVHDAQTLAPQVISDAARCYVAPELLRHGAGSALDVIDGRVDVFSLGVIAHRALTGSLPVAPGMGAEPHAPSHERRPDAPRALTALIDSMLAFQRADRPSAADVRAGVELLFAAASAQQAPIALAVEPPAATVSPEALVALAERQYVRKPRWTPEVRYAEAVHATEHQVSDDRGPDEFME